MRQLPISNEGLPQSQRLAAMWYAHSLPNRPPSDWEPLFTGTGDGHLEKVAEQAAEFADKFGAGQWGRVAGLWHDLGKYSAAFQDMLLLANGLEAHLEQNSGRVDHSTAGAQHANDSVKLWGRLLAYAIAGHHAGLADASADRSSLDARLKKQIDAFDQAPSSVLTPEFTLALPDISASGADEDRVAFQLAFFTRMLFSCLVDADFLATEAFMRPDKSADSPPTEKPFLRMKSELDQHLATLSDGATSSESSQQVDECRQEVLAACRLAAKRSPGLYSLTVPTGGGKTLASLALGSAKK